MAFVHESSPILTVWQLLLIPFTIWDAAYIFLRPASLPGGSLHSPWFSPNAGYAAIDKMYSREGYESGDGFVAAHEVLHLTECVLTFVYLWLMFTRGKSKGWLQRALAGEDAAIAAIVGITNGAQTLHTTVMCTAYEILGGWHNLGHNSWAVILGSWGFISALYFVFSILQILHCARSIYLGLTTNVSDSIAKKVD